MRESLSGLPVAPSSTQERLGIPLGTVYSRLHGARKEFQKAYDRLSGGAATSGIQPASKGKSR